MKIIFSILAAAAALSSWAAKPLALVEHTLLARDFDRVYVSGRIGVDMRVVPDSAGYIIIRSTSAAYDVLGRRHSDGTLYLSLDDNAQAALADEIKLIRVYVDKDLSTISTTGRAEVAVDGAIACAGPVVLIVNGPSTINAASIQSVAVSMSVTGSGTVNVSDLVRADNVNCSVTGSGHVKAHGIDSEIVSVTLRGSGSVTVAGHADESAAVAVKGSGSVDAADLVSPLVKASVFGPGEIIYNSKSTLRASGKINQIKKSR
ncbi:MAG: DUF2807 domain-containing protein [Bacteroidales bacterium]|nr:DUF2807 domain-containing protein [Bacteroidales bacterium]